MKVEFKRLYHNKLTLLENSNNYFPAVKEKVLKEANIDFEKGNINEYELT